MKQYLAIDIGGTAVKLGIVDEEGRVLSKTEQSVCFDNYETPILTTVLSAAEQFLKEQAVEPQGLAGHRRFRRRTNRHPKGHRGRDLRQPAQLHRKPH